MIEAQDEVRGILESKLPPKTTRTRIEGVQSRLTNLLVFHFGTVMVEVDHHLPCPLPILIGLIVLGFSIECSYVPTNCSEYGNATFLFFLFGA